MLGQRAFQQPVVTFSNVRLNGVGLTGGSLDIVLNVYNPNHFRLDATRLRYQLLVDSLPLGNGETTQAFAVNEGDSTKVNLPLSFQWAGVSTAVRDIMNTGTVNYRVKGDLLVGSPVGNYTIPYDQTGRFSALSGNRP